METCEIIKEIKKDNFICFKSGNIVIDGLVNSGCVIWQEKTWNYGIYNSINGITMEGVYFIPTITEDTEDDDIRIYGWREKEQIEEQLNIEEKFSIRVMMISDCEKKLLKLRLKL